MIAIPQTLIRKQFYLFFLLFNFQFVSGDMFAQSANDVMQELMRETGSVGMSVAVVKKQKLIFTGAYGDRDLENKKPLELLKFDFKKLDHNYTVADNSIQVLFNHLKLFPFLPQPTEGRKR